MSLSFDLNYVGITRRVSVYHEKDFKMMSDVGNNDDENDARKTS